MNDMKPEDWLITFDDFKRDPSQVDPDNKNGRPFGDFTDMAYRVTQKNRISWDIGCNVKLFIGGYNTMNAIREQFQKCYNEAYNRQDIPFGKRGYIYLADWRLNPNRVIYSSKNEQGEIVEEETFWDWIKKLMIVGIKIRIMVWLPTISFEEHIQAHIFLARLVRKLNIEIRKNHPELEEDIGVVILDTRVAENLTISAVASHHQKYIIIRGINTNIAFCGGVDLAYTRRDLPFEMRNIISSNTDLPNISEKMWFGGDNESGIDIPIHTYGIPTTDYEGFNSPTGQQETDLFCKVYENNFQIWHDQHLQLEGPIVATLENIFRQRWNDVCFRSNSIEYKHKPFLFLGGIISSADSINELPKADSINELPNSNFIVQPWQTIPLRPKARNRAQTKTTYSRGEFSIMAGLQKACRRAEELILIFDQFFWDLSYARLLAEQFNAEKPNLHLIIILPPHSDQSDSDILPGSGIASCQHALRRQAIKQLPLEEKPIKVYSLWYKNNTENINQGIYCHAKVQIFDKTLLVCGSSNINRRSFRCDTELDCAIFDSSTKSSFIINYFNEIWCYLFNSVLPDEIKFDKKGWGKTFYEEFNKASQYGNIISDPWNQDLASLPKHYRYNPNDIPNYENFLSINDPSSLPSKVDEPFNDGKKIRQRNLSDIVELIENGDEETYRYGN